MDANHSLFRKGSSGRERGFTLIEVMVTMLILGLLMVGIYRIFSSQEKLFRQQEQAAEMQENLRATTEFMNQEMSWVGYQVGGLSVAYASSTELLFLSNIPNTGTTINFVRYKHDPADDVILRVVSDTLAEALDDDNLRVLASDVDSLTFSYFNVDGAQIAISDTTPAVSSMMGGVFDPTLRTIQRIRSTIVIRSSRPDWTYTHPTEGDHFRRRAGIIDVKARNLEDITLAGTGVGTGQCSSLALNVSTPGGTYAACPDKTEEITNGFLASTSLSDNPQVTVNITMPSGTVDTVNTATVTADKGYHMYDSSATQDNLIISGETLYVSAGDLADVDEDTVVTVTAGFRNTAEVGCLQVTQTETIDISSGMASRFDTQLPYGANAIVAEYVDLSTGDALDPQPPGISACSPVSNVGIRYEVRLVDDCGNGIEGQTVQFTASQGSFQTGTQDNADGTYDIIYIPPDTMAAVAATDIDTVTATWVEGSQSHGRSVTLGPGPPDHIVIEDITGPAGYGFVKTGSNSFALQRVNNQLVQVSLSVLDQCDNRVFGEELNVTTSTTYGTTSPFPYPTPEPDGTYSFYWITPDSCGDAIYNESIEVAHVSTPPETVTFDLLTTPETVLNLAFEIGLGAPDTDLFAGGNAPGCLDQVVMSASILENAGQDECHNLTDPFTADFTVAGRFPALGNGSFDPAVAMETITAASDGSGKAWATLYNGEALWNQKLDVSAVIYLDGAPSSPGPDVPLEVQMKGTAPDAVRSGMYATSSYAAGDVRGLLRTNRSFGAGDIIYPRMIDCDENERRALRDPDPILPITKVTLESLLTGDMVTVPLAENLANDADFRADSAVFPANGVITELSSVADTGDDILQVRYGDLVTMSYSDKDSIIGTSPDPFAFFNVAAISGPRWIELYHVDQAFPFTETLITPGFDLTEGDWYRAKLYFPEFEGDTLPDANGDGTQDGFGTMTITAEVNAYIGGETDVFTLREVDNTGVFVTDAVKYGVDYNTVSKGPGPGSPQDEIWLNIPYTPDRVTLGYPDLSSPLQTNSFMIRDTDLPAVSVMPPVMDAGTIPIEVFVDDVGNYIDPGITEVWLNIDGIFVKSWFDPPDNLTPPATVTYDWVTESGGQIFWLNGQHTVYAWARDKAGNWERSADVTVTVNNPGSTDITFNQPPPNGHYSQNITVAVQAPDLFDPSSQTYTCSLSGAPNAPADVTMAVDNTCTFVWDISSVLEGPYSLSVVVTDNQGNVDITDVPRDIYVDNTGPTVTFNDPAGIWIPQFVSYPVDFTVVDNPSPPNGAGVAASTVQFSTSGVCGPDSGTATLLGGDDFRFIWAPSCSGVEGSQTWSVDALDRAVPANNGTGSLTVNVDTVPPVMGASNVVPVAGDYLGSTGKFVKGTVVLNSSVMDTYAATASVVLDDLSSPVTIGRPLDNPSTGAFHYTWDTAGWPQGVYEVTPHGWDIAGNTNAVTVPLTLYVDNTAPSIIGPDFQSGSSYITSVENVIMAADAEFGHLNRFGVYVYDAPSAPAPVESGIGVFPSIAGVAYTTLTFPLDSRYAPANGTYYIQGYASDHAGNETSTDQNARPFEVCNRYATLSTVSWVGSGGVYDLTVTGQVVQLQDPPPAAAVAGAVLKVTVLNLDQPPNPYVWQDPATFTTDASGQFAYSVHITPGDMPLASGNLVTVSVRNTDSGCDPSFPGTPDADNTLPTPLP